MAADPAILTVGAPAIAVRLRRSARARRMTLRVAAGTGEASVTAPPRVPLPEIRAFLGDHLDWLLSRQAAQPDQVQVVPGAQLVLRGNPVTLVSGDVRSPRLIDGRLIARDADGRFSARVAGWLKEEARRDLVAACDRHAGALAARPARITLRDTRSRWGSCTAQGALMFSWRLVLAPPEVLDYVALHEMAHLREMNHSRRFWALVEAGMPHYRARRDWLRREGASLHKYRF